MKRIIKLLEDVMAIVFHLGRKYPKERIDAINALNEAIALLKTPRFYTPEVWEAETGKPWPEGNAVYWKIKAGWNISSFHEALVTKRTLRRDETIYIICATEAGCPGVTIPDYETPAQYKERIGKVNPFFCGGCDD